MNAPYMFNSSSIAVVMNNRTSRAMAMSLTIVSGLSHRHGVASRSAIRIAMSREPTFSIHLV